MRFRPVLMTALAMMIGMVPMALGLGEGGEQNAPLGRAVIGGLLFATTATLIFVPVVFSMVHTGRKHTQDGETNDQKQPANAKSSDGRSSQDNRSLEPKRYLPMPDHQTTSGFGPRPTSISRCPMRASSRSWA